MTLLQTIRQYLGKDKSPVRQPFLALEEVDIRQLRKLRSSDEWPTFISTLDRQCNVIAEAMLTSRDSVVLHEMRGIALGLRKAGTIVDELLNADDERSSRERESAERAKHADDPARVALYASPYFSAAAGR